MLALVEATEDDRGKGDGPDPIVDFFEGDRFVGERDGDKQRPAPRDVAILIDAADFCVARIFERRQVARHRPGRQLIVRGRHGLVQGLVRAVVVVLGAEAREASVLRRRGGRGRPRGGSFEDRVKLFVRPVCSGWPGAIRSGTMPSRIHHTAKDESRPRPGPPNGGPLSLRMRSGNPYSAKARVRHGRVTAPVCAVSASHRRT